MCNHARTKIFCENTKIKLTRKVLLLSVRGDDVKTIAFSETGYNVRKRIFELVEDEGTLGTPSQLLVKHCQA